MNIFKKTTIIIGILLIGGLGGIIADKYIFPHLANTSLFKKYEFLRSASDNVTVINKTEQVYVKEETSIEKISSQASSSVVNIISYPDSELKNNNTSSKNGTGIILTSDGMIITHSEALNLENSKYKVLTLNENSYDAQLVGVDSYSGLAFLKIEANNLPSVSFGNSDDIKPGEKIISIGNNSQNYANEYASGLISEFNSSYNLAGKNLSSSEKMEGLFFSDISPKDNFVGGPIVDYLGQVAGIIGSKTNSDSSKEYFEIPANKVKLVAEKAMRKELDKSPILGIYYIPITKTYSLINNSNLNKGALIHSQSGQQGLAIINGSPAQKAGLKIGDVITKVDDQEIDPSNALSDIIYKHNIGDDIKLTVLRGGEEITIKVKL